MRSLQLLVLPCIAGTALMACTFDARAPDGAQIECGGDDDCPTGLVCSPFLSLCVPISGDREAPVLVESLMSATRLGPADVLEVTIETDEAARNTSLLQVGDIAQVALVATNETRTSWIASVEASALGTGVFAVSAVLVDDAGNAGANVIGTLEVDADAPGIEDGSAVVVIAQPPGTPPVADPPLAIGGQIDVAFRLDDLAADVDGVRLVPVDDDPSAGEGAPSTIELALVARTSNAFSFRRILDVAVTNGPYSVVVDASDDVGNAATLPIATVQVVGTIEATCVALREDGTPACTDADGDGAFGIGEGCGANQATDCDDSRATVLPGAPEIAGNGVDDDCDGVDITFDDAEADGTAVFVVPGAPDSAAGTRAEPLGNLQEAAARGVPIFMQQGTFETPLRVEVTSSIVGGLDETWQRIGARTTIRTTADAFVVVVAEGPSAVRGIEMRGNFCQAILSALPDDAGMLLVSDVDIEHGVIDCGQSGGIRGNTSTPTLVTDMTLRTTTDNASVIVEGIRSSGPVILLDSRITLVAVNEAVGIAGSSTGVIARSFLDVTGDDPAGVLGDADVVGNVIRVTGLDGSTFGPMGLSTEQVVAHNTIEVVGDGGIGIATGDGVIAANIVTVTGSNTVGVRAEDYGVAGVALHGNSFDVDNDCTLRFGRDDPSCLPLEACTVCASSSGNAVAPAVPDEVNAIDLGAPTSLALDIDGDCRARLPPAGAGTGAGAGE